ncbi:MAG: fibronectin type III domain-containing protein, partial [Cyclobacteriaceae bacterium]
MITNLLLGYKKTQGVGVVPENIFISSGAQAITVLWDSDFATFQVRYGTSESALSNLRTVTQNSLTVSGLSPDIRYYFQVRVFDGVITSNWSETVSAIPQSGLPGMTTLGINHPYFDVPAYNPYSSANELLSDIPQSFNLFVDTQIGVPSITNFADNGSFLDRALKYLINGSVSDGNSALRDIDDRIHQSNNDQNYDSYKNIYHDIYNYCVVASWCADLFGNSGNPSLSRFQNRVEELLNRERSAGNHRYPLTAHWPFFSSEASNGIQGGWAGHQNTMTLLHLFYAFASASAGDRSKLTPVLDAMFRPNGLIESYNFFLRSWRHNQGIGYAGVKSSYIVMVDLMLEALNLPKHVFDPAIKMLPYEYFFHMRADRKIIVTGERNNNAIAGRQNSMVTVVDRGSLLDGAFKNIIDTGHLTTNNVKLTARENAGFQPFFDALRKPNKPLSDVPTGIMFPEPHSGYLVKNFHDYSGGNPGQAATLFDAKEIYGSVHADGCVGALQVLYDIMGIGKGGQITNNPFSDHAKYYVKNVAGNCMQVFPRNSSDDIEQIGGVI